MKKKIITVLLFLGCVIAGSVGLTACNFIGGTSDGKPTEGLKYTVNSDDESYSVTGIGTATETDIVIASEFNGKPVTSISSCAFYGCSSLTSVTIPDSVTEISSGAFYGCTGLTSITIPDSVTSIGNSAFNSCSSLTSITIGNSVTSIGGYAFEDCTGLTSITFKGTTAQWNAISKDPDWNYNTGNYTVHCTDGYITKS